MNRIITKRQKNKKIIGWIKAVEYYPVWSAKYSGIIYELYGADGNIIAKDICYNHLHEKLYSM